MTGVEKDENEGLYASIAFWHTKKTPLNFQNIEDLWNALTTMPAYQT